MSDFLHVCRGENNGSDFNFATMIDPTECWPYLFTVLEERNIQRMVYLNCSKNIVVKIGLTSLIHPAAI